jgi:hypothetical protein
VYLVYGGREGLDSIICSQPLILFHIWSHTLPFCLFEWMRLIWSGEVQTVAAKAYYVKETWSYNGLWIMRLLDNTTRFLLEVLLFGASL